MEKLIYGTAYYDEYMPYDRLAEDVKMMKKAGINTVRIAESTWSTCEPQEGVFDFSHVERVLDAMEEAGIQVIVGTPTYAIPTWMVKAHPDVIATTKEGQGIYGARQIMDITHPVYRFYAERVIRKLMEVSAHRKCVIGFQVDNETKYYGTAGKNVQLGFVKYLREKFHDDLDAMNHEFGLDYWSNRINAWEDFPDVRGTINGSLEQNLKNIREVWWMNSLDGRQISYPNIRDRSSLLHTILILNGEDIRMVYSRMSITSRQQRNLQWQVLISIIQHRMI